MSRVDTWSEPGALSGARKRIDSDDYGESLLSQFLDERREIPRIGDEDDVGADLHEYEVRGQCVDVVQRQREDGRLLAVLQVAGDPRMDRCKLATRLRFVRTRPFATPVVPPVYCRNAMSSWSSRTSSNHATGRLARRPET